MGFFLSVPILFPFSICRFLEPTTMGKEKRNREEEEENNDDD